MFGVWEGRRNGRSPPAAVWLLCGAACFPAATPKLTGPEEVQSGPRAVPASCEERVTCHLYLSWAKRALRGRDVMVNVKAVSRTERVTRKSSFILSHLENAPEAT